MSLTQLIIDKHIFLVDVNVKNVFINNQQKKTQNQPFTMIKCTMCSL